MSQRLIKTGFSVIPAIFLLMNYGLCNQSRNYTAYEYALDIFRTTGTGDILLTYDDNNVFPVAYGRIVEKMREDIKIYDHLNLIFKLPNLDTESRSIGQEWTDRRFNIEKQIIGNKGSRAVYYAVWVPNNIKMPEPYNLVPFGLINIVKRENKVADESHQVWRYYSLESFNENFYRDYMNREVTGFFNFSRAKQFFSLGHPALGVKYIKRASQIGYDDELIHPELAIFLINIGLFEEGRQELEKAMNYYKDMDENYNNWGYYYHKIGESQKAITSFEKAIAINPKKVGYYNNLGYELYESGRDEPAYRTLKKSLSIDKNQPDVIKFIEKKELK